jgi:hypothetical protein
LAEAAPMFSLGVMSAFCRPHAVCRVRNSRLVRWRQRANNGAGPTSPLGTPELYFTDPDNIRIQIQDASYRGGSGRLGQICRRS